MADVDALVVRPACGHGPVVVYVNACTARGIEQPAVPCFLRGLAAAGFVVVAPELPHVKEGEITPATVEALVGVAHASGRRVALVGASTGAGLAILAAGDPRVVERVSALAGIAPFASLRNLIRLATTGFYGDRPFAADSLVARATTRSLLVSAPDDPAVAVLLANRDPQRFDRLYAQLAPSTRTFVDELSPLSRIGDVRAPVELLVAPSDRFFPADEARELARLGRDVRLTVTRGLQHVRPRAHPGVVRALLALERTLGRAAQAEPASFLRPSVAT